MNTATQPISQPASAANATGKATKRLTHPALRDNLLRLASIIIVLIVWEIYGRSVNKLLFAPISSIAFSAADIIGSGELWKYLSISLVVMAQGLGLGVLIGVPLGVLMARVHIVDTILEMYISALYAMPLVAVVPLLVLWFGFDTLAKTIVVFLFTVFPMILNTYQGVRNVEPNLLEVARSFCSNERQVWRDVVIPSALPYILVGFRLSIGRALIGMVIADFYMAVSGIGYLVTQYANSFQTAKLFVPILTLMLMGVALTSGAKLLEARMTPWLRTHRGE
jgi:ABC-type nitrate/sulfonate/bicarbonate transport system permease component